MVNLEALFTDVDDFCQKFVPGWEATLLELRQKQRNKPSSKAMSEVMTILILFHVHCYRDFKTFYLMYVCKKSLALIYNRVS